MNEILEKYKDKTPFDLGISAERTYSISSVIDMMKEHSTIEINSKIKEIENWLIVNTSLEIEKIVDFKEKFMN